MALDSRLETLGFVHTKQCKAMSVGGRSVRSPALVRQSPWMMVQERESLKNLDGAAVTTMTMMTKATTMRGCVKRRWFALLQ